MLTSYWVSCPDTNCRWKGDLLPRTDRGVFATAVPTKKVVTFVCPRCQHEFHGRVKGDDVVPMSMEEEVALTT